MRLVRGSGQWHTAGESRCWGGTLVPGAPGPAAVATRSHPPPDVGGGRHAAARAGRAAVWPGALSWRHVPARLASVARGDGGRLPVFCLCLPHPAFPATFPCAEPADRWRERLLDVARLAPLRWGGARWKLVLSAVATPSSGWQAGGAGCPAPPPARREKDSEQAQCVRAAATRMARDRAASRAPVATTFFRCVAAKQTKNTQDLALAVQSPWTRGQTLFRDTKRRGGCPSAADLLRTTPTCHSRS